MIRCFIRPSGARSPPARSCRRSFFNAFRHEHRRKELPQDKVEQGWDLLFELPLALYAPENLMPRAVEITSETGAIFYDALFVSLVEETSVLSSLQPTTGC